MRFQNGSNKGPIEKKGAHARLKEKEHLFRCRVQLEGSLLRCALALAKLTCSRDAQSNTEESP